MGRGLSSDEKRVKLLEIFHETKDFYQLKELEKLAPKIKGIVSQSVKEVLQSLVDDGLVQSDKVGASNCLLLELSITEGCNGAELLVTVKVNAARRMQQTMKTNISELSNLIEQEKVLRPETTERNDKLGILASKKKEIADLQSEISKYGACDPTQVEAKRRGVFLAHEAAVRWTDNFSLMRTNFLKQSGADWASLQTYLGISDVDEYENIE